jgi:serine/threonine-protein kinase ATR
MEFNGIINRLLQKTSQGRKRKLRLRTYAVICLNEECGVLEWVPHTTGYRQVCNRLLLYTKATGCTLCV